MKHINDDKSLATALSLGTWRRRSKLSQEMYALNDRMLADIGVCRAEIPLIVEKSYPHFHIMTFVRGLLAKWAGVRTNRDTARILATFDNRMLADIGLSRSDISSIAKGYYPDRHSHTVSLLGLGYGSHSKADAINDDHRRAA